MFLLRKYQQDAVDQIREAYRRGRKAPMLVSATGSGKAVTLSYIAAGSQAKGNRIFVLVHRYELIRQLSNTLKDFQVPHGIIAGDRPAAGFHLTQIASVQTLVKRLDRTPDPDLIIVDECHHSVSPTFRKIFERWPTVRRLGCTATPARLDGSGLGQVFDEIVLGPPVQQLIDDGFLARPVYFAPPSDVDTSKLHVVAGDFNAKESEVMMDTAKITGDCVSHYTRLCAGKPAIAFCVSIRHAEHIVEAFNAVGYRALLIEGKMDDKTRADRISSLADGRINVLVSVDLLGEGVDVPVVAAAILLRPTASLALHLQQLGRPLRPAPGKGRAIILDHVGNCLRHGLAEEPREWSLDSPKRRPKRSDGAETKNKQCPSCYAIFAPAPKCPQCGHILPIKSRTVAQVDGELIELTAAELELHRRHDLRSEVNHAKTRAELAGIAKIRGYKPGWVTMMLQRRFMNRATGPIGQDQTIESMAGGPRQPELL